MRHLSLVAGSPRIPDFSPIKARWGKDGGLGGKGNTSRASRGVSLPPKQLTNSVNRPWSIFSLKRDVSAGAGTPARNQVRRTISCPV